MGEKKLLEDKKYENSAINRYLEFVLGTEKYAVPLLSIKEVIPLPETTVLPNCPDYFIGIMNLRGQIISIIDLRKKLKIKSAVSNLEEAVVIVDFDTISVGLIVDSIERVITFDETKLSDVPQIKSQINAKFIKGIFKDNENLTIILDLLNVLNIDDIKKIVKK